MRILVIGAGAVGGYFGGRLAACGRDVTFLVRQRRAEQLRSTGLVITSPHGSLTVEPKLLLAEELHKQPQHFDLILLSTKAYSLQAAMEDFAPAVGPETMILPLLNGLNHLDALITRFGEQSVLGGCTRIVADLDEQGHVHSMEKLHDLVFGERDGSLSPRIQAVAAQLAGCGFDGQLSTEVLHVMWQKWVLIASLAGITCLLNASIGAIAAVPYGKETERAFVDECANVARPEGFAPKDELLRALYARFTQEGSQLTASMFRDRARGNPVEADHILGAMLERGRRHGVETPLLQAAYVQLAVYESVHARPMKE